MIGWTLRALWACAAQFTVPVALTQATRRQLTAYLLVVVAISAAVLTVPVARELRRHMAALTAWVQELPTITIVEGTVTIVAEQPLHLVRRDVPGVGHLAIIVDTSEAASHWAEPMAFGARLTAHELILRQGRTTRSYDLRAIRHLVVDDAWLAHMGRSLTRWVTLLVPIVLLLYGLAARLVQALVWSGIGWWSGRLFQRPVAWRVSWRVAVLALGPPVVFATVVEALLQGRTHPLLGFIQLCLYALIVGNGLRDVQAPAAAPPAEPL